MQPSSYLLLYAIVFASTLLQGFVLAFASGCQTRLQPHLQLRYAAQRSSESTADVGVAATKSVDDGPAAGGADRAADLMSLFTAGKAPMQQHAGTATAEQQAVKPLAKQQKKKAKADSAASSKGSNANQLQSVDFTTAFLLSRELASTIVPSRVENAFQLDAFNMAIGLRMLDGSDWLTVSWHPQVYYCFTLSKKSCVHV
jgi:hypothetical protein